jgi:hypothetical protein
MASIDELKSLVSTKLGFARSNQFLVVLPGSTGGFFGGLLGGNSMNLLCASAEIPGKQILTHDRQIGMLNEKMAYGYANPDVSMTFYALNDYGVVKYFNNWHEFTLNQNSYEAKYKNSYAATVEIHQLRKPILGKTVGLGPVKLNLGLGGNTVHGVKLIEAFPTSINAIELSNELDGLVQLTVQLSYTRWSTNVSKQGWITAGVGLGSLFN